MARALSPLPWLAPEPVAFPDPLDAWHEPNGLLAAGGALTPSWLITAYRNGIFPWFDDDAGPILWWSPDPRATLEPGAARITRSLSKRLRNGGFRVSADNAFAAVVDACAAPRDGANGTWITPQMKAAYLALHELGYAHSVEVWRGETLVGGLYGVAVGRLFCGESMFSQERDASKVAFAVLAEQLRRWDFALIDCQLPTAHLESLGACERSRNDFLATIDTLRQEPERPPERWTFDADLPAGAAP